MLSVGITGSFGTGKSTVAWMFARQGAKVLDADEIVHELMAPRGKCFKAVLRQFGPGILQHGRIDRKKLAGLVFADPDKLKKLENIIHPAVKREIQQRLKELAKHTENRIVAVEVPLLLEAGWTHLVDCVIVVTANRSAQLKRIQSRQRMVKEEIFRRIQSQMPLKEKIKMADFVVDNSRDLRKTKNQVKNIWEHLVKNNFKNINR